MLNPHVRWMVRRDFPEVLDIEQQSFQYHWTEEDFTRHLRQRNTIGLVAEHDDQVLGYMVYDLHRDRIHVLNFAVRKDARRQHIGDAMVRKLIGKLTPQRRNRIVLEVRETNLVAQLFWRAEGFRAIRIEHQFYDETDEDAYVFQYRLASSERTTRGIIRSSRLP
jgi:[ribosomal protein S18]-alanine N-acetyltransferase